MLRINLALLKRSDHWAQHKLQVTQRIMEGKMQDLNETWSQVRSE